MILRRILPLSVFIATALPLTTVTLADETADAKKAIATNYVRMNAAAAKKDVDGMVAFYTPDFTYKEKNGTTVTLSQVKQQTRTMISSIQTIKAKSQIVTFKRSGSTAIATIREHVELSASNPQTNQPAKLVVDGSSEDTWVKSGAKWLMKKSKSLSQNMTMNGKPFGGK